MIDYHREIRSALSAILPTHYEMVLHSGLTTPCYSYMELGNNATDEGDTLGYSRLTYQVKVWANDIALIQQYAQEADIAMRAIGFKRIGSNELEDNNSSMIQKIMTYEALGLENF